MPCVNKGTDQPAHLLVSVSEQAGLSITWSQTSKDKFSRDMAQEKAGMEDTASVRFAQHFLDLYKFVWCAISDSTIFVIKFFVALNFFIHLLAL